MAKLQFIGVCINTSKMVFPHQNQVVVNYLTNDNNKKSAVERRFLNLIKGCYYGISEAFKLNTDSNFAIARSKFAVCKLYKLVPK